jgi:hypothetical protein
LEEPLNLNIDYYNKSLGENYCGLSQCLQGFAKLTNVATTNPNDPTLLFSSMDYDLN